jgi:hypothetical protein
MKVKELIKILEDYYDSMKLLDITYKNDVEYTWKEYVKDYRGINKKYASRILAKEQNNG